MEQDTQPDLNSVEENILSSSDDAAEEALSKPSKFSPQILLAISIVVASAIISGAYIYVHSVAEQDEVVITEEIVLVHEPVEESSEIDDLVYEKESAVATSSATTTQPLDKPTTTKDLILAQIPEESRVSFDGHGFQYVDDSGAYKIYKGLNLDKESFVYINEDYVKDKDRLYYRGDEVYGFDPSNCSPENIEGCRHDVWRDTINPYELEVAWYDQFIPATSLIPGGPYPSCTTEGYQAGLVTNGPLANNAVYMQTGTVCDMWCGGYYRRAGIHYVSFNDQLIRVRNEGFTIAGIDDFPDEVSIPGSDLHLLTLGPAGFADEEDTQARFLFNDPRAGNIFDSGRGNYHSVRDDHIRMEYELEFPFWREDEPNNLSIDYSGGARNILNIDFDDGTKNQEEYSLNGGYGESYRIEDEPGLENRLVREGQFSDSHPVYSLVNSNDHLLQELYDNKNTLASYQNGSNKYTYDEFISHRPLLYWKNPFGDWVELLNRRYETAAEKCKPVIYLYPEEEGDFEVYVEPNGGFTETIPEYGDGWKVTATPYSQITDRKTGEMYPYLYWEGINTGIPEITEGWVVDVSNIENFLNEKLVVLGMNEKEIADFNEYWVDRLRNKGSEYYKIMFVSQAYFDVLSPLTVTGDKEPDSIIRVMMYAQSASIDETLPEQVLPETPKRKGFTVVEWGGAILN